MTIKPIIDAFVSSEWFANWQAENLESGGYARPGSDARDRFERCYDVAEDGADGSTYRESIADMREAFGDYVRYGRRNRNPFAETPWRVLAAADRHFDGLETWFADRGMLDSQIG